MATAEHQMAQIQAAAAFSRTRLRNPHLDAIWKEVEWFAHAHPNHSIPEIIEAGKAFCAAWEYSTPDDSGEGAAWQLFHLAAEVLLTD